MLTLTKKTQKNPTLPAIPILGLGFFFLGFKKSWTPPPIYLYYWYATGVTATPDSVTQGQTATLVCALSNLLTNVDSVTWRWALRGLYGEFVNSGEFL